MTRPPPPAEKRAARAAPRLVAGSWRFADWSSPEPYDEKLQEALHTARYSLAGLTQADAYRILAAAEAYVHFAGHPAPTNMILAQLRELRRARRTAARSGR